MADVDGPNVVVADAGAEATGGLGPERALARCSFLTQESLVLDWLLAALTAAEAEASPRFTAIEHVTCDDVDVRAFGQMGSSTASLTPARARCRRRASPTSGWCATAGGSSSPHAASLSRSDDGIADCVHHLVRSLVG
jgi:hypothetical protein